MPALRLTHRRRSSLAVGILPVRPGNYGINPSPRNVTFAPNVTPGTYVEELEGTSDDSNEESASPADALFPPAEVLAPAPTRRRAPPGKRRSQGYIPRPPNAFMLFRANFVRQKHVPGSIETNHGSLSKIIGNCWNSLPAEEKKVWESKAKKEKALHREKYPHYRFRPVHNKAKKEATAAKRKDKTAIDTPDERRCEEVAHLLLEGKKGDELAAAVRKLDLDRATREMTGSMSPVSRMPPPVMMPTPLYAQRRPSSVPPPSSMYHPIAIPSVSFLARSDSPVNNIARSSRFALGQRRPSSAGPVFNGHYGMHHTYEPFDFQSSFLDPLPDINTSLFDPSFLNANASFNMGGLQAESLFDMRSVDPHASMDPGLEINIGPLENVVDGLTSASTMSSGYPFSATTPGEGPLGHMSWLPNLDNASSSSAAPSQSPTPDIGMNMYLHAPQPQQNVAHQGWHDPNQHIAVMDHISQDGLDIHSQLDYTQGLQDYACGLEQMGMSYAFHDELNAPIEQY